MSVNRDICLNLKNICLVSPFPPPQGGMAVQAEKLMDCLRKDGLNVATVRTNQPLPGKLKKVPFLRTLWNLTAFLIHLDKALRKTDTVYILSGFLNFFFWVTFPAIVMARIYGKKIVISARGGGAGEFFQRYGVLVKKILLQADAITTPSGYLQDVFWKHYGIQVVVVPNIADLKQFGFIERKCFRPRLLVTRSLEEIYDVGCVIRAFQLVQARYLDAVLGIAGIGTQKDKLKCLVKEFGLEDQVTFYGEVNHSQMQKLYKEYDILGNASTTDNLPGTILEAFASGLAIVTTNAGGIPHMIQDGITGILVDVGDCRGLADQIVRILENPELGRSLTRNGLAECDRYSWDHIRRALVPLLCSLQR
ncbi:MAG: glycosyltransferase [Chitinivibrionales bacterium]|nr:glycosyltransferase [Chitinivibrionales bacterium]